MEKQYKETNSEFKLKPMYWVPNKVVMDFFQSRGQSLQDRVDALNEAIDLAGFSGVKAEVNNGGWSINGPQEVIETFKEFYQELKGSFPKGQFEWEEEAVRQVILKYQRVNQRSEAEC